VRAPELALHAPLSGDGVVAGLVVVETNERAVGQVVAVYVPVVVNDGRRALGIRSLTTTTLSPG